MSCRVCNRQAKETYCNHHQNAYENLIQNYTLWRDRTAINWNEYLRRVKENPNSGRWVVEVSLHLLAEGAAAHPTISL
jgi:hypothetical protein